MAVFSTMRNAILVASTMLSLSQPSVAFPAVNDKSILHLESLRNENITGSLFKRQNNYIDFSGVQQGFGPAQGQVPVRQNFKDFAQDGFKLNLYILALQRMQQQPQTVATSFYGTAGIHGRPYKAWDNVYGGLNNGGYCLHADILFPSWHRPYMALYEQILWEYVQQIAGEFPAGGNKQSYMNAVASWRMPYWDWASDASVPPLIGTYSQLSVEVPGKGMQTIHNPLYSYQFNPLNPSELPDSPFNVMPETGRYPAQNAQRQWVSQSTIMNQQLVNIGQNLKSRVYTLLTAYSDIRQFADKGTSGAANGNFDSLEGVHDTIHSVVGGNGGHMSFTDYAAFDPIFFLHHANVDRIYALWQAINPGNSNQFQSVNSMGTFAMLPNSREDALTPLTPFHASDNQFWTTSSVGNTKTFGYTYPELVDWNLSTDLRSSVIRQITQLYGTFNSFGGGSKAKRTVTATSPSPTANAQPTQTGSVFGDSPPVPSVSPPPKSVDAPPTDEGIDAHIGNIIVDGAYNEWLTEMSVKNSALDGSFNILIFMGDFSNDPAKWAFDPNLVGTHSIFTSKDGGHDEHVSGSVPLTNALINQVIAGKLPNLQEEHVVPFLRQNLHWRVQINDGSHAPSAEVDGLVIHVATSKVELPTHDGELPQWGPVEIKYDITDGRNGGRGMANAN